jgi:penicillin amidase
MKWVRVLLSLLLAAAIFWALDNRHGLVPPFGKLLNPFAGFWQNGTRGDRPPGDLAVPGLRSRVTIAWDSRQVPHIFAANDHDLYLAQGYIAAYLRLWQMEFQVMYAGGRLSEVVGPDALPLDRFNRRFGMVWAAESAAAEIRKDSETRDAAQAYSDGVNAYLNGLKRKDFPVEYKILDYGPEPWTDFKCGLLLKYMAYMLSGRSSDTDWTRLRAALGEAATEALFPYYPPLVDPVIPPGTPLDFKPLPIPQPPSEATPGRGGAPGRWPSATPGPSGYAFPGQLEHRLGSNNWAVSGKLTRSGFPILCDDMHLGLTLPMIWYEVQLSAPGLNVRGVSLPGAPGVVVGYTEKAAWGFTNGTDDVADWYAIRFKDSSRREYLDRGQWKPTRIREERIKVRGSQTVVDRVVYTHFGPVFRLEGEPGFEDLDVPPATAVRWVGHDPSNEFKALLMLNRAQNYEDYLAALKFWDCPSQNFVYADSAGTIALWHNGKFPLRWKGQGRYILDARNPADEWQGWIPHEHNPHVKNPERGFVSSANQPAADAGYPYYLGSDYASYERGARINEILAGSKDITAEDMIRMQGDVLNIRARAVLPRLLELLKDKTAPGTEKRAYGALRDWNFENRARFEAPTVFERLWTELNTLTWNDEKKGAMDRMPRPESQVMADLILNRPDSEWFDDKATPGRETLADIALQAFRAACRSLEKEFGPWGESWAWGKAKGTHAAHLGRIPGLGRDKIETDGVGYVINAVGRGWAPSWRMVVDMGPAVRAWGIYPGGQSGNPGSKFYDNFLDDWAAGKPYELIFLKSADERHPGIVAHTTLRSEK